MNFNSGHFLVFLPIVVSLYWLLPHKYRWIWLLATSYYFYGSWNPVLISLILLTTLISYGAAIAIDKWPKRKKVFLWITLLVCLGILVYFKYANFIIANVLAVINGITEGAWSFELHVLLPVGISFYTFQTLSYVIDVYRGDFKAEKHFGYYALYVSYFPQLVAGPIENPRNLLPQLRQEHRWSRNDFVAGIRIMLCGFFRKCVVADFLGIFVNQVFSKLEEANSLAIAIAGALFCIQMYCDFAGYSEIAAGAARMMGVRLMRNFDRPYLAQSYTEFFRRWHISLNQWFTNYLYIPLGGSQKGMLRKLLNIVIVFALCGLWHGANWTYVLWGLYAAFFLCLESLLDVRNRFNGKWDSPIGRLIRRSYMFLIFIPAALLFRAESVRQISEIIVSLFSRWGFGKQYFAETFAVLGLNALLFFRLILCIVTMCQIYKLTQYDLISSEDSTLKTQRLVSYVYLILVIAMSWLALIATDDASGFAYFQF